MSNTVEQIIYCSVMVAYLVLFIVMANTLARMQRALTRIADKLDQPVPEKPQ